MKLVIDWHNYGFSILRVNRVNSKIVKLAQWYETFLGKFGDYHLCVSETMKDDLQVNFGVNAHVLYDRATDKFKKLDAEGKHDVFDRVFKETNEFTEV